MPRKVALMSAKAVGASGLTEPVISIDEWLARDPLRLRLATVPSAEESPVIRPVRSVKVAE